MSLQLFVIVTLLVAFAVSNFSIANAHHCQGEFLSACTVTCDADGNY
ncbi:hypothetical protein [Photobacterium leiognathi]|nr:hypothetical protein [Photobacterium leiognathi]